MRVSAVAAACLCLCAFAAAQSAPSAPAQLSATLAPLPIEAPLPNESAPLLAQAPANPSQPEKNVPWQHFTWEAAGGFTQPNGTASDLIHLGWNTRLGAGLNFSKGIGLLGEFEFNRFGWQSPALSSSGAKANGSVHILGVTLEPIWRYKITDRLGGYAVAGAGFYRQTTSYANTVPGVDCNPFFGCYPTSQGAPPSTGGNQVGANGGLGFTYKTNPACRLAWYTEVRFEWLDTDPETAAFFPVNVGVRW